jgi:hypothetical protein
MCIEATDWGANEVDVMAYGAASGMGMGSYFTDSKAGFQSVLPHDPPKDGIFFFKALMLLSIVDMVCFHPSVPDISLFQ